MEKFTRSILDMLNLCCTTLVFLRLIEAHECCIAEERDQLDIPSASQLLLSIRRLSFDMLALQPLAPASSKLLAFPESGVNGIFT